MFKRKSLFVVVAMIIIAVLAGCSNSKEQNVSSSGGSGTHISGDASSILDVITKAQQTMSKQNGYTAETKMQMNTAGTSSDMDQTITITKKPQAYHETVTTKAAGNSMNTEIYYVDAITYSKLAGRWMKMSSSSVNSSLQQSQQSENQLKMLQALVQAEDKTNAITMTQTGNGDYQLKIDVDAKGSQKLMDIIKNTMGSGQMAQALQSVQINAFKATILIDGKTYQFKETNSDITMVANINGTNSTITQHSDVTYKGEFTGTIEVPADVKANATEMSQSFGQ